MPAKAGIQCRWIPASAGMTEGPLQHPGKNSKARGRMPIEIRMPALSPTMTEGNLAKWLKKEGDQVAPGDVIAEIETDKATMEVEAVDEGTLGKIVIGDGTEGVPVNAVIGVLLEEGEDAAALQEFKPPDGAGAEPAQPEARAVSKAE